MPPTWPTLPADHALLKLHARLPDLVAAASGHRRIWGVELSLPPAVLPEDPSAVQQPDFATLLVLQKFLRSQHGDVDKAVEALGKTLKWRSEFGLDKQEGEEDKVEEDARDVKFDGLGWITRVGFEGEGKRSVVCTWNIYGAAAKAGGLKVVFGDLEKPVLPPFPPFLPFLTPFCPCRFLRWRVDLMERSIAAILEPVLSGKEDAPPIPDYGEGEDPYQGYQVHDYMDISFLRMDPDVKAASKATIEIMSAYYPEWLSRKFFVSVPLLMSWVFQAVRLLVSAETSRKFTVVSYKSNLVGEFDGGALGKARREDLPQEYGGTSEKGLGELAV
ncbi:hypothetical protein JCM8097_008789 [Rhodosporidiobolus ruineniae]